MGLDMYAHTIREDLVADQPMTDVDLIGIALKAVGFDVEPPKASEETSEALQKYYDKRREARDKAIEEGILNTDFCYWRKFNNLHGWMERLYKQKGGTSDSFNCNNVRLTIEDLDRLQEDAMHRRNLDATRGFFFGPDSELTDGDIQDIITFVINSRVAIREGKAVFYDSWW